jgi:hypothetical protein|tara:strand:+ start:2999 stop:6364 length:3366 start_codon:yes stop_codon:yes gene_type:complete
MATSSRQSGLFGVNDWKAIYETFREADFRSYDYETLRKSFIDYLRLYYPETYNDYIESSEFIALLDVMAFMGQGLAFRNDLNTRENFIDTAERRDSVVKLADLVSYTPKRNTCASGYLKVSTVRTSESITDANGVNLSNVPISWNDPSNQNWLDQMNTVFNAAMVDSQKIGRPGNSSEILGVTTSEYGIQTPTNTLPIVPFTTIVDGTSMNFELVSATSLDQEYVYEIPPAPTGQLNMLYRNDKLGFGSPNTGFMFYFKQGSLQPYNFNFQQQISNQSINIDIEGVNQTDTWLYQTSLDNTTGLWKQVENVYADAYLQTESSNKKIFSVGSRANDQVTYVFGDGVFSEMPIGSFRAYVRSSNALTYTIDPSEMNGVAVSITYVSRTGRNETLTMNLALPVTVTNAQGRESLSAIKQRAPTRYYTQNRMVNGEDYTNFPYTLYNSIIKSKAINRSSIGVSKNLDLLDPTGKYSSTNSFGDDGALYQESINGFLTLQADNTSDIIQFFTDDLASVLALNRANQYYIQNYTRYAYPGTGGGTTLYWKTSSVDSSSETGYFYSLSGAIELPQPLGTFTTTNAKYATTGALLKFIAPNGNYFDADNRLVAGVPTGGEKNYIWSTVLNVVGDGNNNGEGKFANGQGPVTLNGYVPNGVTVTEIIPVFDNSLSSTIIQQAILKIELQQDFTLIFNNALLINQERWSIGAASNANYFVKFTSLGNNRYTITYRSLTYYFGSVADTRFTFNKNELVYDPFTGKIIQDFINVLGINTVFNSAMALGEDTKVNILGQTVESDGYVNDFQVEIAATDVNNGQLILDPDFFNDITGYVNAGANIGVYVFFRTITDPVNLTRQLIVPSSDIVYTYGTKNQIEIVKYEFAVGQLFYAYTDNKFYKSVQDPTVTTPSYIVTLQTDYSVKSGRQGIDYQYRHNANNTTRIDPATTNIVDLYLVTQAYYTAYNNYVKDTTSTVVKPNQPTLNELNTSYPLVQDYKMLSDSVILNSVTFKPLFGAKADQSLRATIKVVKSQSTNASNSEIRSSVLAGMDSYFDINNWNFGDTFFFSELSAYLHEQIGELLSSVILVSDDPEKLFGDLYEIKCRPYEIFVNAAVTEDIVIVPALTPATMQS